MRKAVLSGLSFLISAVLLCSCQNGTPENHTEAHNAGVYYFRDLTATVYFWQNEDGSATMDICNEKGRTIETLEFPVQNDYYLRLTFDYAFSNIKCADYNFDKMNDLYVPCSTISANLQGMCWLWNNNKKQFELSEELSKLPELTTSEAEEQLRSCDYSAEDGPVYNYYEWHDGVLTLVHSEPLEAESKD